MTADLLPFENIDMRSGTCDPVPAEFWIDGWAGRVSYGREVIGETPKRYRIRMLVTARLIRRTVQPGDELLVPKRSVVLKRVQP